MAITHNKQITLSTREKVKRLKKLIQDAKELRFNPKLIKNFMKQLKDQETILKKDMEKRKKQNESRKK